MALAATIEQKHEHREAAAAAEAISIAERLEHVAFHLRGCAKSSAKALADSPGYMRHWLTALDQVAG